MNKKTTSLTPRQQEALQFIRDTIARDSCPPTVRELSRRFGYRSPRGGTLLLDSLERKGYLKRTGRGARQLALTVSATGVPIVGDVAAGSPILAVENVTGSLDLGRAFGDGDLFAVRVKGDSMRDAGIFTDDFVVVRRQPEVLNGAIGVAYVSGEATVKRIYKTRQGYRLQPENKSYSPIEIKAPRDADDTPPDFRVAGSVVGVVRMMRQ
jgi:repressor LexA